MQKNKQIAFGPFKLDEANECLWRGTQLLALRPKAFAVLKYLLERPGHLVTKQQLLGAVWPDTFVGEAVLKDSIRQLREVLEDDAKSPQFIETAHRRGYRFIGQITEQTTDAAVETAPRPDFATTDFKATDFKATDFKATDFIAPEDAAKRAQPLFSTGMFGREAALADLQGWLEMALAADRQIVFVTGEPGIGKTTLVEAFLDQASTLHTVLIARGQCLEQYGAGEPYLPVLEAFSRLSREPGGSRVIEVLRRYAPTWLIQMPALVNAADREALQQQILGATRDRMLREMADAIEALTSATPLVLVLEDLHWSDYSTLDLVSYLARRRETARLMVIATYRPVEVILSEHPLKNVKQELVARRLSKELPLEYLTEESVAEFLDMKFPRNQFPQKLALLIHRRTEGNPLFMVNLADYLLAEGIIFKSDEDWQLRVELAEIELGVPENVRRLIEKQIERLSPEEQRVLEAASVVGLQCSAVAIGAALACDVITVEERCEELARRHQFLTPSRLVELPDGTITPRHKFIHGLYMDVLYDRLAISRRAQMHLRVGNAGEAIYGDRVTEIAAELAVHFEQGRDLHRAVKYLQLAAENAASSFANHEAITLIKRAVELLKLLEIAQDPANPHRG